MHRVRTEIDGAMPTDLVQTRQHLGWKGLTARQVKLLCSIRHVEMPPQPATPNKTARFDNRRGTAEWGLESRVEFKPEMGSHDQIARPRQLAGVGQLRIEIGREKQRVREIFPQRLQIMSLVDIAAQHP